MSEPWLAQHCPHCGGVMTRVENPPPIRRLRHWFNYGARPRGQVDYACPDCGHGVSISSYCVLGGHSLRGRISHFRSRRTLEPTPRFYAIVAVAGIGGGLLVSRVPGRGQAWWQLPCLALSAAWLFMESSALWGHPPELDTEPEAPA